MDLTLISIVLGLGLTELLLTFYRLVQARRRVVWDPLPLAWALLMLIAVVNYWWGIRARTAVAEADSWTAGVFMLIMVSPVFLFLACAAALPRIEPGARLSMKSAYAEERAAFLLFFLAYHCGNWMVDLAGLGGARPPIVYITRGIVSAALVAALLARSRSWDWLAVAVIGAAFAVRLVTQLVS